MYDRLREMQKMLMKHLNENEKLKKTNLKLSEKLNNVKDLNQSLTKNYEELERKYLKLLEANKPKKVTKTSSQQTSEAPAKKSTRRARVTKIGRAHV